MRIFLVFICLIVFQLEAGSKPKKLLITGCGRSGTNYMAKVLEHSGWKIHHERYGKDGCVSWPMAVNSYSPWGPISKEHFLHTFHQVRNPLSVITSWAVNYKDLSRDEWVFIRRHVPEITLEDSVIVSAAKYWYYWNLLAEQKAEWRYKIEDLKEILTEFHTRSGIKIQKNRMNRIQTNYNSWESTKDKFTWEDLERELPKELFKKLQSMAKKYGYL